jgi:hypothetical protein
MEGHLQRRIKVKWQCKLDYIAERERERQEMYCPYEQRWHKNIWYVIEFGQEILWNAGGFYLFSDIQIYIMFVESLSKWDSVLLPIDGDACAVVPIHICKIASGIDRRVFSRVRWQEDSLYGQGCPYSISILPSKSPLSFFSLFFLTSRQYFTSNLFPNTTTRHCCLNIRGAE